MTVIESKLRMHRKSKNQGLEEYASFLGISVSYLSELETGARTPGFSLALAIEQKTGGFVKPSDFRQTDG